MPLRFSLLQLLLLSAGVALGLGLYLSHQRAQDYWLDKWYFEPQSVDFSPDGKLLVISFPSGEVVVQQLTPTGFKRLPCSARWAGRTGLGHPRFVANDRFVFYQDGPGEVRSPWVATWDVAKNRPTPDSPFEVVTALQDLDQTYRERNGTAILLLASRNEFVVMPGGGKNHRHIALPNKVIVESWDISPNGRSLVVLGFPVDNYGAPARRLGFLIDLASGVTRNTFAADSTLLSQITIPGNADKAAVLQARNPGQFAIRFRSTEDWSLRDEVEFRTPGIYRNPPSPLRFSDDGGRVVVDAKVGEVWVLDIAQRKPVASIQVAPPLFHTHPRALGHLFNSARRSNPSRFTLSPDGESFAVIQEMHVDLQELETKRFLGRAWTAWSPAGPIRRHIVVLIGFGLVTGLIWRWQNKTGRMATRAFNWVAGLGLLARVFVLASAITVIVRVVPTLFLPPEDGGVPNAPPLTYLVLAVSVLAIAQAISSVRRTPARAQIAQEKTPEQ